VNTLVSLLQANIAPRSAEAQLLDVDGTVVIMLGLFLVLMLVLWHFLWKPYLAIRDDRVARVEGARKEASALEAEALARTARVESDMAEARRSANAELAKLRLAAQAKEQQIVGEAQAAAQKSLAESLAKLEVALNTERANLKSHTASLAREMAEKTLGRRFVA